MTVKVILKQPAPNGMREFTFEESVIIDDKRAGYAVLSYGMGGQIDIEAHWHRDESHIAYAWNDIERLEVTP